MGPEKVRRGEQLYFAALIPLLAIFLISTSSATFIQTGAYRLVEYIVSLVSVLLILSKVMLADVFPKREHKYVALLLLVILVCQCMLLTRYWDLALAVAFCIGAYKIDLRKILKVYLFESLAFVLVLLILSLLGIIPNSISEMNGVTRYALGNFYCTDFAARIFFLMLTALLLYHKQLKYGHLAALAALAVVVFLPTHAKLDCACMLLALLLFALDLFLRKGKSPEGKSSAFTNFWCAAWKKTGLLSMPVAALLMGILTYVYSPENKVLESINQALTQRLTFGKQAFSSMGVTWFGQYVMYQGGYETSLENYNFVDCSYLHMLFREGILATVLILVLYVLIARRHKDHLIVMYTITLIALNCMFAHHLIEFMYNPFLILFLADTTTLMSDDHHQYGDSCNCTRSEAVCVPRREV